MNEPTPSSIAEAREIWTEIASAAFDGIIPVAHAQNTIALSLNRRDDKASRVLRELVTLVRGECPSLLDGDRGGDGNLSAEIDRILAQSRGEVGG